MTTLSLDDDLGIRAARATAGTRMMVMVVIFLLAASSLLPDPLLFNLEFTNFLPYMALAPASALATAGKHQGQWTSVYSVRLADYFFLHILSFAATVTFATTMVVFTWFALKHEFLLV